MSVDILAPQPSHPGDSKRPWYEQHLDHEGVLPEHDLPLPPELSEDVYNPLYEVAPALREHFGTYWDAQMDAIHENGGMVVEDKNNLTPDEQEQVDGSKDTIAEIGIYDAQDRRDAFMAEARFFNAVVSTVDSANREEDLNNMVVFFDVDETIGQVPTYGRPKLNIPGLTDVSYGTLKPEQKQRIREANAKAQYDDIVFRPALSLTVNHLMDKYGYSTERLQFGLLTSHKQKALAQYVLPRLQKECPGAFLEDGHGDNIISCNDSWVAAKLGRDVATLIDRPEEIGADGKPIPVPLSELMQNYPDIADTALNLEDPSAANTSFQETKLVIAADRITEANDEIDNNTTIILVDDWRSMRIINNNSPQLKAVYVHQANSRFIIPGNYYYDFEEDEVA